MKALIECFKTHIGYLTRFSPCPELAATETFCVTDVSRTCRDFSNAANTRHRSQLGHHILIECSTSLGLSFKLRISEIHKANFEIDSIKVWRPVVFTPTFSCFSIFSRKPTKNSSVNPGCKMKNSESAIILYVHGYLIPPLSRVSPFQMLYNSEVENH